MSIDFGFGNLERDAQRVILDLAEPTNHLVVKYNQPCYFAHGPQVVDCQIRWDFTRTRKNILTSVLNVTLTRTVLPDHTDNRSSRSADDVLHFRDQREVAEMCHWQRCCAWWKVSEEDKKAYIRAATYKQHWSEVKTISFIPHAIPRANFTNVHDQFPFVSPLSFVAENFRNRPLEWSLKLECQNGQELELPTFLRPWHHKRKEKVDNCFEILLKLQRFRERNSNWDERVSGARADIIIFECEPFPDLDEMKYSQDPSSDDDATAYEFHSSSDAAAAGAV